MRMTEQQRMMLDGMDRLLRRFNRYSQDKEFTVRDIIEASNEVYRETCGQHIEGRE